MIRNSSLQRSWFVVLDVEGQGALQELDGEVVLADGVKDEADVAVDQSDFRVVLADDHQGEVAGAVQQLERGAGKAKKVPIS